MQNNNEYGWLALMARLWAKSENSDDDGPGGGLASVRHVTAVAGQLEGYPQRSANELAARLLIAGLTVFSLCQIVREIGRESLSFSQNTSGPIFPCHPALSRTVAPGPGS